MGDRCTITINIEGHIETVEDLHAIIAAIQIEGMHCDAGSDSKDILSEFAGALDGKYPPSFTDWECNYADISTLEDALQTRGIGYSASHDAGGDYAAAVFAYFPGDGRYEATSDGDGPAIPLQELRRAMSERRRIDAVWALIHAAEKANGVGLPKFSVSDEVRKYLTDEV